MGMHVSACLGFGVAIPEGQYDQLPWGVMDDSDKPESDQWIGEVTGCSPYSGWRDSVYEGPIIRCIIIREGDNPLNVIVAIGSSVLKADYGKPISSSSISVDEAELAAAHEFCAEYGIPFEDPKWLLFADMC